MTTDVADIHPGDWFKNVIKDQLTRSESQEEVDFLKSLEAVIDNPHVRPPRQGSDPKWLVAATRENLIRSLHRFKTTKGEPASVIEAEMAVLERLLDYIEEVWVIEDAAGP